MKIIQHVNIFFVLMARVTVLSGAITYNDHTKHLASGVWAAAILETIQTL